MAKKKAAGERPTQFDAEKLERESQAAKGESTPLETEHDKATFADKFRRLLLEQMTAMNNKELEVLGLGNDVSEAKLALAQAKTELEDLKSEFIAMSKDFARGQSRMEFDGDKPAPMLPFDGDPFERHSVAELQQPLIRRMAPEEFAAAKRRDEPVGLTDVMVKALQELGYGLIGGLEAGLRSDPEGVSLKCNFSTHQAQILADTLALWRKHHPVPVAE
jgi:hypothetical protein